MITMSEVLKLNTGRDKSIKPLDKNQIDYTNTFV